MGGPAQLWHGQMMFALLNMSATPLSPYLRREASFGLTETAMRHAGESGSLLEFPARMIF